jgi:hypothetical protein
MVDVSYTLQSWSMNTKEYQMIRQTNRTKNARIGLQYGLTNSIINTLELPFDLLDRSEIWDKWKYVQKTNIEQTQKNLIRLTPNTKMGKSQNWSLMFSIISPDERYISIKGALRGDDGTIALMTSISPECQKTYKYQTCGSMDTEWKICQCKMIAPPIFWIILENIINNKYIDEIINID